MLWIKKAAAATFALCAVFVVGVGVGLGTRPSQTGAVAQEGPVAGVVATNQPKPAPATASSEKAIDELTRQIEATEKRLAIHKNLLKLTVDRFALMRQLKPEVTLPAEEVAAVPKFDAEIKAGEGELQVLKAKLAKLKADKAVPPAPVGGKETALLKLDELKAQLDKIEAERAQLIAQAEIAKQQLLQIEQKRQALQRAAEVLAAETERGKRAAGEKTGWRIEVTVRAGGEFVVWERRSDPRVSDQPGTVRTDDHWALGLLLKHAKADPNGPQEVRILFERGARPQKLDLVYAACESAGFKPAKAEVIDPPAPAATGSTEQPPGPEERLRSEQLQRQQIEAELKELLKRRDQELLELKKLREAPQKP